MAKLEAKDLREKTVVELQQVLRGLQTDQFNNFMKKNPGQLTQQHLLKDTRKNIARVKTLISEKAGL
jgi:large subunit ribosomal protein L29